MKMIWAVIRPESSQRVIDAMEKAGMSAMTRLPVTGYGKELGITDQPVHYSEIQKEILMIVLPDNEVAKAVMIIRNEARTVSSTSTDEGTIDEGKIFVTYVDESFTIRATLKTIGAPGP